MELSDILTEVGTAIIRGLKAQIISNGSSSSGNLVENIKYNIYNENTLQIEMPEYAEYVDKGTKPHMPPVDKIEKWANSKHLNVWAVAMNIKKYGTRAKPFLYRYEEILKEVEPELIEKYGILIDDYVYPKLKNIFNKNGNN